MTGSATEALCELAGYDGCETAAGQFGHRMMLPEAVAINAGGTVSEQTGLTVNVMSALLKKCTGDDAVNSKPALKTNWLSCRGC
jgi:hypothetical protein